MAILVIFHKKGVIAPRFFAVGFGSYGGQNFFSEKKIPNYIRDREGFFRNFFFENRFVGHQKKSMGTLVAPIMIRGPPGGASAPSAPMNLLL